MSSLVVIEEFKEFDKVKFYTFRYIDPDDEEAGDSETDKFLKRFTEDIQDYEEELNDIISWIVEVGTRGLGSIRLRLENNARALPPMRESSNLRLYCIELSDTIVILGNGGIKTARTAQDSKDLSMKLHDILEFEKALITAIKEKTIVPGFKNLEGDLELYI